MQIGITEILRCGSDEAIRICGAGYWCSEGESMSEKIRYTDKCLGDLESLLTLAVSAHIPGVVQ